MDPVAVANLALGWLGSNEIVSFDDLTRPAELIKAQFAGLRQAVLEDRDWTFATARLVLAKDPVAPLFGGAARYVLPSTVLRVITAETDGGSIGWSREGNFIVTEADAPSIQVRAIVDVEDSRMWSPGFCQALAARIAADLCIAICEDASLASQTEQLYLKKLRDAAANDGRQGRSRRTTSDFLARRRR